MCVCVCVCVWTKSGSSRQAGSRDVCHCVQTECGKERAASGARMTLRKTITLVRGCVCGGSGGAMRLPFGVPATLLEKSFIFQSVEGRRRYNRFKLFHSRAVPSVSVQSSARTA